MQEQSLTRTILAACLLSAGLSLPAHADVVRECDDRIGVGVIAEPWEEWSRSYANNTVRVAVLDYEEPASSSLILMVLYWTTDPHEGRICKFITQGKGFPDGWAAIRFDEITSDYNPSEGLILSIPVLPYDAAGHTGADESAKYNVTFAINRSTGTLTLK